MRKLFRGLGVVVVSFVLVVGLGCAGVLESVTGMEVLTGEDAVHPADFPLDPPEQGAIIQSMTMDMAGMRTVTVQYELPGDVDQAAILDRYAKSMKDKGYELAEAERTADQVTAKLGDGSIVTVQLQQSDSKAVLSLVSVQAEQGQAE